MTNYSSASTREPHVNRISRTDTIVDALKRRAQAVLNDRTIDPQSRAIIRYALEINDPWLARLVRSADAGESVVDMIESQELDSDDGDADGENIEALAGIICRSGEHAAAALFVLMAKIECATHPKALANTAKHVAYSRCGELNLFGMVDTQVAVVEGELLERDVGSC